MAIACVLQPTPAGAIPVFARIYDKPCGTCHTVFPQLNPAGENFRAHGLHGLPAAVKPLRAGSLRSARERCRWRSISPSGRTSAKNDVSGPRPTHALQPRLPSACSPVASSARTWRSSSTTSCSRPSRIPATSTVNSLPEQAYLQAHAEPAGWLGNLRLGWFELPLGVSPRVHRLSAAPYLTYGLTAAGFSAARRPESPATTSPVLDETQIGAEIGGLAPASGFGWVARLTNGSNNRSMTARARISTRA